MGFSMGVSKTLSIVEAITGGVYKYPDESVGVSDTASQVIIMMTGLTALIGTPLSSLLNRFLGFSKTMDCLSVLLFLFYIILVIGTMADLREEEMKKKNASRKEDCEVKLLEEEG